MDCDARLQVGARAIGAADPRTLPPPRPRRPRRRLALRISPVAAAPRRFYRDDGGPCLPDAARPQTRATRPRSRPQAVDPRLSGARPRLVVRKRLSGLRLNQRARRLPIARRRRFGAPSGRERAGAVTFLSKSADARARSCSASPPCR